MTTTEPLAQFAPSPVAISPSDLLLLTDVELTRTQQRFAEARRALDAAASMVAAEIAYRSRRESGPEGFTRRSEAVA